MASISWNKAMMRKTFLVLLSLLLGLSVLWAQDNDEDDVAQRDYLDEEVEPRPFNEETWKGLTRELDYSRYEEEEETPEPLPESEGGTQSGDSKLSSDGISGGAFFQVLFFAVILVILGFVIWKIFGNSALFSNKKIAKKAGFTLEEIEDNLTESDVDRALREAMEAGNYHLAIRLQFLAVLKELSLQNRIRWKKDKTNGDYLYELSGSRWYAPFGELTYLFEIVWYGELRLTEELFLQLQPQYEQFIAQLKNSTGS